MWLAITHTGKLIVVICVALHTFLFLSQKHVRLFVEFLIRAERFSLRFGLRSGLAKLGFILHNAQLYQCILIIIVKSF